MSDKIKCRWPSCENDTDCMSGCKPAPPMTHAPSIKEALELKPCPFCGCEDIKFNHPNKEMGWRGSINCPACLVTMPRECGDQELIDCWNERAAIATFQPAGERREAIAREIEPAVKGEMQRIRGLFSVTMDDKEDLISYARDVLKLRLLASGLVQDEAGISQKLFDRAIRALEELTAVVRGECPSILNEDSGGDGELSVEIDEIIKEAEAIRSARNGGGS